MFAVEFTCGFKDYTKESFCTGYSSIISENEYVPGIFDKYKTDHQEVAIPSLL